MLAKDLRYDQMESAKEKEKLVYTRLSVKKKENENTDRAKYHNLLRVLAQSVLSTSHKPLSSTHRELKQLPSTSPSRGQLNKRSKQLEDQQRLSKKPSSR